MFPQIKYKDCDRQLVKNLQDDLLNVKKSILGHSPSDFNKGKLDRIRIRVFRFPRNETCNEFFIVIGNKKYVCLNSSLLKRRYYAGFQHVLHGITHHFSHFRSEIGNEVFCEFVGYSVLKELLEKRGRKKFQRRIMKSVMNASPREYNSYYRIGRKMDKREENVLFRLNSKAKNKKISRKNEKKMFSRLLKTKIKKYDYVIKELPELEKGFRKV